MEAEILRRVFALQNRKNIFEDIIQVIYSEVVGNADVVLDGGAHMGLHSIPLAHLVGTNGTVFAFEPIPDLAGHLKNLACKEHLSQLRVVQKALSDRDGETKFHWVKNKGEQGYSGICKRNYPFKPEFEMITVPLVRVDAVFREGIDRWRFCKLDLEGGEFHALMGAITSIRRFRPLIVFENGRAASAANYGYTKEQWFSLFKDLGYVVFDLFGRPFSSSLWDAPDVPWYFVGAAQGSEDEAFTRGHVPRIVERLVSENTTKG